MTEAEWLACGDPDPMLDFLRDSGRASERKLRLFACACCRQVWEHLSDERSRFAVGVAERYVDSGGTEGCELTVAFSAAQQVVTASPRLVGVPPRDAPEPRPAGSGAARRAYMAAAAAACCVFSPADTTHTRLAARTVREVRLESLPDDVSRSRLRQAKREEARFQTDLLRDLFGNPFRPAPVLDPAWLAWQGGAVRKLAETAYEDRRLPEGTLDPARLAVLADALEDAGCCDPELLGHLRGQGPHVRGWWALDLILGKE